MHDAFVSYSHKDREWVVDRLLPPLRQAGLQILTDLDDGFELAAPSVENMERAVEHSRHTILVLTPSWVESSWTAFEALLSATADPAARKRKLVPLMVQQCQVPRYIGYLSHADFTEEAHYDGQIRRLIARLTPADAARATTLPAAAVVEPVDAKPVREGFEALAHLLEDAEIRDGVREFLAGVKQAGARIDTLAGYKDLHDLLHALQLERYEPMAQEAASFPASETACDNLLNHTLMLQQLLADFRALVGRGAFPVSDARWVERELAPAVASLDQAVQQRDAKALRRALLVINGVLAIQPVVVNTRLNDAARALGLHEVANALRDIHGRILPLGSGRPQVATFASGVESLDRVAANLASLVGTHDAWQALDIEIRRIHGDLAHSTEELELSWDGIQAQVHTLSAGSTEPWAAGLATAIGRVAAAVAEANPERIRSTFRLLRRLAAERFLRVDLALKKQCDELRQVCDPLVAVLRIVE